MSAWPSVFIVYCAQLPARVAAKYDFLYPTPSAAGDPEARRDSDNAAAMSARVFMVFVVVMEWSQGYRTSCRYGDPRRGVANALGSMRWVRRNVTEYPRSDDFLQAYIWWPRALPWLVQWRSDS